MLTEKSMNKLCNFELSTYEDKRRKEEGVIFLLRGF